MTPEEKAKELVGKFMVWQFQARTFQQEYFAKQCAAICVRELIDTLENLYKPEYTSFFHGEMGSGTTMDGYELKDYYSSVLTSIQKQ